MAIRFARILVVVAVSAVLVAPALPSAAAEDVRIEETIVVRSDDGTPIVATLMLPAHASARRPVPAVLATHGWGGNRERTPSGELGRILDRGYAVLTWDSRGFGESGGEANVGAPAFEVQDAFALIDYLSERDEILQDGPGDPRVGWIGASNAGGVQLNAAALDRRRRRIEAIVPIVPWGNLPHDLLPNGVAKFTWDELLYFFGAVGATSEGLFSPAGSQTGNYAQPIHVGSAQLHATGNIDDGVRKWFHRRSTTVRAHRIATPTLIVQGSIDTLFPLNDAFDLYRNITGRRKPPPVKVIAFCNGHTLTGCPYPGGDSGYPNADGPRSPIWLERALDWLDRYVKGKNVSTGPEIEYQAQDGFYYGASRWPLPGNHHRATPTVSASLVGPGPGGGDGLADGNPAPAAELGRSAARAPIFGPTKEEVAIVGMPIVDLNVSLFGANGHLFFELVDVAPDGTRVTVDDQVTPVEVGMGTSQTRLRMHGVAWILKPGHVLELEITTHSTAYEVSRLGPFQVSVDATTRLPMTESDRAMRRIRRA